MVKKLFYALLILIYACAPQAHAEPRDTPPPLQIETAADTQLSPAVRVSPPPPPAPLPDYSDLWRLDLCGHAHDLRVEYGLPDRFDYLVYRESKCHNDVRTYCCYGLYQLYWSVISRDHRMIPRIAACGVDSLDDIYGETADRRRNNTCVARALYDTVGYQPWAQ